MLLHASKLLCGIEQDLRTCVVLRQSSDVIHESDIIELLCLCNPVTDTQCLACAREMF